MGSSCAVRQGPAGSFACRGSQLFLAARRRLGWPGLAAALRRARGPASVTARGTTLVYNGRRDEERTTSACRARRRRHVVTDVGGAAPDRRLRRLHRPGAEHRHLPGGRSTSIGSTSATSDDSVTIDTSHAVARSTAGPANDILIRRQRPDASTATTGRQRRPDRRRDGTGPDRVVCATATDTSSMRRRSTRCPDCEDDDGSGPTTTIDERAAAGAEPERRPRSDVHLLGRASRRVDLRLAGCDRQVVRTATARLHDPTDLCRRATYTFGVAATDQFGNRDPTRRLRAFSGRPDGARQRASRRRPPRHDRRLHADLRARRQRDPRRLRLRGRRRRRSRVRSRPFTTPALGNGRHTFTRAGPRTGRATSTRRALTSQRSPSVGRSRSAASDARSSRVGSCIGSLVLISGRPVKMSQRGRCPIEPARAPARKCKGRMAITTAEPVKPQRARSRASSAPRGSRSAATRQRHQGPLSSARAHALVKRLKRFKAAATIREVDLRGHPRISSRIFILRAR